ncbi:hypothetical protein [Thermotalea metallivorans]|uniref:Uncharacterized protein n=1 Tax=Thermotalea metallivorans TaxID=520762 RepID=A0A140LCI2_9FIRM|nr:hypothetical protein [Thermotalea metallivorans]KXG78257.1 hypothetical protein AN619_02320 [Thermotalea metallivorans]
MLTIQLADNLYREHGLISIIHDGKFVEFENYIEKEEVQKENGQKVAATTE